MPGFKSFTNLFRGERLDLRDLVRIAERSLIESLSQLGGRFIAGDQSPYTFVVSGFEPTLVGNIITVDSGVAIMGLRDRAEIFHGMMVTAEGAQTFDASTLAVSADPYFVWVRMNLRETSYQNRAFWNETGAPNPTEYTRSLATRRTEDWSIVVEKTMPGSEWMSIAQVDVATGPVITLTKARRFFFEGYERDGFDPSTEILAADHDDDRLTNGVFGLNKFVRMVAKLLAVHRDSADTDYKWWKLPTLGLAQMFALDGSRTMDGDVSPTVDSAYDLGTSGEFWDSAYINTVNSGTVAAGGAITGASFVYGTPLVRWRSATGATCTITESGGGELTFSGSAIVKSVGAFATTALWNIDVPEGVTIDSFKIAATSLITGWTASVFRRNLLTAVEENLVSTGNYSIPTGSGHFGPFTTDQFQTVANGTYAYYLVVFATGPATGTIQGVSVGFTASNVQP